MKETNSYYKGYIESDNRLDYLKYGLLNEYGLNSKALEKQYQNMLVDSGVTILNKFDDKPIEERKINYRYYLKETIKIIEELQPRQLSLFT